MRYLDGKRVLVTGACGTVGSELVKQLLAGHCGHLEELIGVDNNESQLFFIDQEYLQDSRARFVVGDIRDAGMLGSIMDGIDFVFHVAALKHVILCERSPYEAVQSNIQGVQNVITAATENNVEKVIFTSSDKAVNPTNVMGTSKLMGERLMTAANSGSRRARTIFASTRFGNVLGSSGSVIPIFKRQIANGGPVTLTDEGMTRFVMSVEESVRLVVDTLSLAMGGEVFITKMPVIRIKDLAEVMIDELASQYGYKPKNIELIIIGSKPGEKLYEELMSYEETRRAIELPDYFSVLPAFRGLYKGIHYDYPKIQSDSVKNPYISSDEKPLNKKELNKILMTNRLLPIRLNTDAQSNKQDYHGE